MEASCAAMIVDPPPSAENLTFNFSLREACRILLEHQSSSSRFGPTTEAVLIVAYCALMLIGVIANLMVIWVVARRPAMRTARNLYIVNLTVSDLTLCLICMPFSLVATLRHQWTLGSLLCKAMPAVQGTNIMVSIGTITIIALDRYLTIVRCHDASGSTPRVVLSIFFVWMFSFIATLPVATFQVVEPFSVQDLVLYEGCIEKWPSDSLKLGYAVAVLLVQSVIPALVVAIVHARIASYLHVHAKTQKDSRRAQRELQRNRKTSLLLTGVAVLFLVSWLPLSLFSLLADLLPSLKPPEVSTQTLYLTFAVCHLIAMTSAVTNPLVYGFLNSNIRQELCRLVPGGKCGQLGAREPRASTAPLAEATTRTALPERSCRQQPPEQSVLYTAL